MRRRLLSLLLLGLLGPLSLGVGLAAPEQSLSVSPPPPIGQKVCSLADQLQTLRVGLLRGSRSLKKFLRRQLRERAPAISEAELRAAFEREHDPAMIEELSGALAARMARLGEPVLEEARSEVGVHCRSFPTQPIRKLGPYRGLLP